MKSLFRFTSFMIYPCGNIQTDKIPGYSMINGGITVVRITNEIPNRREV